MINKKDMDELNDLYFNNMYSFSQIIEHFKNKYSYAEIKTAIMKKIR